MSYDHTTVPKAHPMDSIRVATMLVWQYFLVGTTCLHRKTEFLAPDSRIEALSHRIKYVVNPKTHGIPQSSQGPQGCNIQVPSDRGGGGGGEEGRGGRTTMTTPAAPYLHRTCTGPGPDLHRTCTVPALYVHRTCTRPAPFSSRSVPSIPVPARPLPSLEDQTQ